MPCPTCLAIRAVLEAGGMNYEDAATLSHSPSIKRLDKRVTKKAKRKVSAYSKRYGAAYKRLKKKHPRMSFGSIAKKAHRLAKRT
jgi:predicted DsbA family dithiol-disulfide isomerase